MNETIRNHPEFTKLVRLERERRQMVRRPGGRAALAANSTECFRAEHAIIRATGCSFIELSAAVAGA
jgi:hypothetical protein